MSMKHWCWNTNEFFFVWRIQLLSLVEHGTNDVGYMIYMMDSSHSFVVSNITRKCVCMVTTGTSISFDCCNTYIRHYESSYPLHAFTLYDDIHLLVICPKEHGILYIIRLIRGKLTAPQSKRIYGIVRKKIRVLLYKCFLIN